jgi:uncharacterized protein (DUF305 family)
MVDDADFEPTGGPSRRLMAALLTVLAVMGLAAAVAVGHVWGADSKHSTPFPSATSVDAGFASDMSTHHQQAITMASYARDNSDNQAIRTVAFDIESGQTAQLGEMAGWLDTWGLVRTSNDNMAWMAGHAHLAADGLMPGMATPAQMNKLLASHGSALNILFLQLMIHHHEGGVVMAKYAADNATESYVRNVAQNMYVAQSNEIIEMEQLLRQLGGTQLPAPSE